MRGKRILVWDGIIPDTTAVLTSGEISTTLGLHDQLTFQAVADGAAVSNTLNCDLQHSADKNFWVVETAGVISGSVAANVTNFLEGNSSDNASQQGAAYRRLRMTLSVGSPVHVKIWAVPHDQSLREPETTTP